MTDVRWVAGHRVLVRACVSDLSDDGHTFAVPVPGTVTRVTSGGSAWVRAFPEDCDSLRHDGPRAR